MCFRMHFTYLSLLCPEYARNPGCFHTKVLHDTSGALACVLCNHGAFCTEADLWDRSVFMVCHLLPNMVLYEAGPFVER